MLTREGASNAQDARTEPLRAPLSPEDQAAFDAWHAQYERNKAELAQVSVDAADAADAADDPWRGCAVDVTEQYLPSPAVALSDSGNGGNGTNPRGEVYAVQCPRFIGDHTVTILAGDEPCSRCGKGATAHNIDRDTPRGFYAHFAVWEQENPCPSEDDIEDLPRWLEKRAQFERDIAARGFNRPEQSKRNRGKSKPEPIEATTGNGRNSGRQESALSDSGAPLEFTLDDTGNARRFVRDHGKDYRYNHAMKAWLAWNGKQWEHDEKESVMLRAIRTAESIRHEDHEDERKLLKHAADSMDRRPLESMVALARPMLAVTHDELDRDIWSLNVQNGTIDLRTGELRPHRREDFNMKCAPVTYDPNAHRGEHFNVIRHFLNDSFRDHSERDRAGVIASLQRIGGYTLTGDTSAEVFFLLHGPGGGGKGTFMKAVAAMMGNGQYSQSIPLAVLLSAKIQSNGEAATPALARCHGMRYVAASESPDEGSFKSDSVKALTGNDIVVNVRFNHGNFFDLRILFKIFIGSNYLPRVQADDSGFWRRCKLFRFPRERNEAEKDETIKLAMTEDPRVRSALLAWFVEGCVQWRRDGAGERGLIIPDVVRSDTSDYRAQNDPTAEFFKSRCDLTNANTSEPRDTLYDAFKEWAKGAGEHELSATKFAACVRAELARAYGASHKLRTTKRVLRDGRYKPVDAWPGVRLLSMDERLNMTPPDPDPDAIKH